MKKRNRTYQTAADIVAGLVLASAVALPGPGESPNAYAEAALYGPPSSEQQMRQAKAAKMAEEARQAVRAQDLYRQALYGPPPPERRGQTQQERRQDKKMTQAPKQHLNKAKTRQKRSAPPPARRKRTK